LRRDTGAAIAALGTAGALPPRAVHALGDALALLRNVRALLTLLFDGTPEPEALTGPLGATLARCAGAIDFPRLDADITAACAAVGEWYARLIAGPAARSKQEGGVKR
jgi:hypothetical protein